MIVTVLSTLKMGTISPPCIRVSRSLWLTIDTIIAYLNYSNALIICHCYLFEIEAVCKIMVHLL